MGGESKPFHRTYQRLLDFYGMQHWWPAEHVFEIMVGAILTQNTAWSNVEKAIANLKQHALCEAEPLAASAQNQLAQIIRPSGYYNQKAQRLIRFSRWYLEQGGYPSLLALAPEHLRQALLGINGIGEETADDMVLYAFARPYFVIDSYTRRIFSRLGLVSGTEKYAVMQAQFHRALEADVELYQQYHALIVTHAKQHCLKTPQCTGCPLTEQCEFEYGREKNE
ncbi:MAG: endonuclease III domain-containing protein [Gammaproteobacteria bacterium]|nr:endonuclease III domain-containing protein [Gammaproteobacteria bacterium]